ncbi:MAG: hypothetical protein V4660_14760 [Pseudomonadota bacterium]
MTYKANQSGGVDTYFQRKGVVWPVPLKRTGAMTEAMRGLNSSLHNIKSSPTSLMRQAKHIDDLIMFLKS